MTIRDLVREFVAEKRRMEQAAQTMLAQAWHTARLTVLGMNGKLPALDSLLARTERQHGDIRAQLEAVGKVTGIQFRPATPAAVAAFRRPKDPHA